MIFKTMKRQWNNLITGSWLDDMENSEIFKTMKRQWNILIHGSWLDDMENSMIFKTMKRQWNNPITGSWLDGNIVMLCNSTHARKLILKDRPAACLYPCCHSITRMPSYHCSGNARIEWNKSNQTFKLYMRVNWVTFANGKCTKQRFCWVSWQLT